MVPLRCVVTRSRHCGAGRAEILAGRQTRPDPGFEQVGEVALRELSTDVGAVACFLEEVRVGVQRHDRGSAPVGAADPAEKSMSAQLSPSTSDRRPPVYASVRSSGRSAGEDALVGAQRMRSPVALEPLERVRDDVAAAEREREDAAERAEDPLDCPGRKSIGLQLAHEWRRHRRR